MLKNIIDLTRVFLISSFNRNGSKKKNRIGRYLLYGLLFVYLFAVFGFLSYEILNGLIAMHQEEAFIGIILMGIVTLTLFTTIISTLNVLYFSKDNLFVLPLPLRPFEVLTAKMNTLLVYVYFEEALLGLVPLIMYGYLTGQSILYYPLMLLVLLLLPIVPLLVSALIVICVMALTGGIRNKDLVQLITMLLSIVFSLGVSMLSSSMNSDSDLVLLLDKAGSLVELYKKAFITMPLAVDTLIRYDVLSLLGLIAISLAAYFLVCLLGQKLYYRGALGSLYSSSGVSDKKLDERKDFNARSLGSSYVLKEALIYLRRPAFFTQLVLPCLLLPAFMMGIFYFSIVSEAGTDVLLFLASFYREEEFKGYVLAIVIMAVMFITMYCFISTVAVSKDGHDAYAMKYLPVPFYQQLIFKMVPDIILCLFSYLTVAILAMILFKVPLMYLLLSLPVVLTYIVLHGFLILNDVRKPKLDWSGEMQLVKKNMRTMLSLAFALLNMGITAVLAFLLNMQVLPLALILTFVYALADILLYRYIRSKDIALADNF